MTVEKDPDIAGSEDSTGVIPFHFLIPNLITLMAMSAGLTAIQFGINTQWQRAVLAILLALIMDGLDGATARLLKATSDFGAQLDSLSDFLAFGVAPAVILYTWILQEIGKFGWIVMIFYTAAAALRLSRFNVESKKQPDWQKGFFFGIPTPAGAGLALFPLIIWFQYPAFFHQFGYASPLAGIWTMFVAVLMVSRIPTFSLKRVKVPARLSTAVMAFAALYLAALVHIPWLTLTITGIAYMVSIPFSISAFRKTEKDYAEISRE